MAPPSGATGPSILVVDDEPDIREAMASLLETFLVGAHIHQAGSGLDALRVLRSEAIDLIVTDFKMPGMNGAQFLGEAAKVVPDTPHILVTAFDREAIQSMGPEAAQRIVHKPFEPDLLLQVVEEALSSAS